MLPSRICDPHHHLWELPNSNYPPAVHSADLDTVPQVTSTVFVECGAWYRSAGPEHLRSVGETEFVATHGDSRILGIVGTTDLRIGTLTDEALDAHTEAGRGRFRGIRQRATWDSSPLIRPAAPDPGPGLLADPEFRKGARSLSRRGLVFDAWIYFPQIPELAELARALPDLRIVLDHLGGPIVMGPYVDRNAVLAEVRRLLEPLVDCPNISMKIGGLGMPLFGLGWHRQSTPPSPTTVADSWRHLVDWVIERFSPGRCMFESNFPVDRSSFDYATMWSAFDLLSARLSESERALLFHDTAWATYGLHHG
jgi:L-fuconolactonase